MHIRAETIPRVTRIQKNPRGKLCALKNRLVHFIRDAQNFRLPKIYAAPRRPAVFRFPAVITTQCDALFNIPLYQCAFCSFTAHAHRKSRVFSNNAPTGSFYVVYLFLFAVALLCCSTAVLGNAGNQCCQFGDFVAKFSYFLIVAATFIDFFATRSYFSYI